jgi:hypothetical protein
MAWFNLTQEKCFGMFKLGMAGWLFGFLVTGLTAKTITRGSHFVSIEQAVKMLLLVRYIFVHMAF